MRIRIIPKKLGFRFVFRALLVTAVVLSCFPLLAFVRPNGGDLDYMMKISNNEVSNEHVFITAARPVSSKTRANITKPKPTPSPAAPETVYEVTVLVAGQLGNRMFQYASLLGIARRNKMTPLYPKSSGLSDMFDVHHLSSRAHFNNFATLHERAFATYTPDFEHLPSGKNVRCMQYLQSWKYFDFIRDEIRKEFTFVEPIKTSAARLLAKFSKEIGNKTKIGIHVRRGDMLTAYHITKGYHTAPASYIVKAMDHMRRKHGDVIFVIVTQDRAWSVENTPTKDYVIVDKASATEHLALLASCDHVIMTVGTYGWWAGYLSGGDVVYYWDPKVLVSNPPKTVEIKDPEDFFPPHWVSFTG